MRRWLVLPCLLLLAVVVACSSGNAPEHIAQFWRPISDPNVQMPMNTLQTKLDYDLGQCKCGVYPANATHSDIVQFQPDMQRLAQTGVTVAPDDFGNCSERPSLVVSECMRERGWEPTNCSGRMPLANGGSLCTAYGY